MMGGAITNEFLRENSEEEGEAEGGESSDNGGIDDPSLDQAFQVIDRQSPRLESSTSHNLQRHTYQSDYPNQHLPNDE